MITAVICDHCGHPMDAERVTLPDGRRRFTLTCPACWHSPVTEYSRRELISAHVGGKLVPLGYIDRPVEPDGG